MNDSTTDMTVAEAVKALRKAMNLSQQKMADLLAVSLPTVQRWEWGKVEPDSTGLSKLYLAARETPGLEAANAALVFVRGSSKGFAGIRRPGEFEFQARAAFKQIFCRISAAATRFSSDPGLSEAEQHALVGEMLFSSLEGMRLIAEIEALDSEMEKK